jgi:hypothetical protein
MRGLRSIILTADRCGVSTLTIPLLFSDTQSALLSRVMFSSLTATPTGAPTSPAASTLATAAATAGAVKKPASASATAGKDGKAATPVTAGTSPAPVPASTHTPVFNPATAAALRALEVVLRTVKATLTELTQTRSRDGSLQEIRFLLPPISVMSSGTGSAGVHPVLSGSSAVGSATVASGSSRGLTTERIRSVPVVRHVSNVFSDIFQLTA